MNILLPFSVPSEDRKKIFGKEMEHATTFCLTEIGRKKGGGLILKKPPEEIVFITEACYPIWLMPWRKITLLFDGLGLSKHVASLDVLPDINVFIRDIQADADQPETYVNVLKNSRNYFQGFSGKSEKVINGLITDPAFLKDIVSYLSEAKRVKGPVSDKMMLNPIMDEATIKSSVDGLSELKSALENDIKELGSIVKMLIELADKHTKLLTMENEQIWKRAEEEIARFKSESLKKIEQMQKDYDQKILKISKNSEKEIQQLRKEYEEMMKRKAPLTAYANQCETEISNCKARKDEAGLDRWKNELQKVKGEISGIDKKVSEIETSIKNIEQSRDAEVSQLKSEFNAQREVLMAGLKGIEADRDAKIATNEEKTKSLKDSTSTLITQINRLSDLRRSAITDLDRLGLPQARKKYKIVYLPFFLACYKQEFKRRYTLFPPSVANSMSRVTRIKGVFKTSKVKIVLEDRSESIAKFLNQILKLTKQDTIFEEKIAAAGVKTSILRTRATRETVAKGLVELRIEGWLSENEFGSFNEQLTKV